MLEEKQLNWGKVTGFGAINWDIIAKSTKYANKGEEVELKSIWEHPGGSAANTISWLSDYSSNLFYVGAVGDDERGKKILESMQEKGINTSSIIFDEKESTGTAISLLDEENERTLYTYGGAGSHIDPDEINSEIFEKSDLIHSSSFLSKELLELQKKISSLDADFSFSPGLLCNKIGFNSLKPILKNTDILFINESELKALFDHKTIEKGIQGLIDTGVGEVAVTLGGKGCIVADKEKTTKKEAKEVEVTDTTGAGDAFASGYLLGYLEDLELSKKGEYGIQLSAKCIQKLGGGNYSSS